jgi:hypothetical protein
VRVKFGGIIVGFKEGDMEDGMKTRMVRRKTQLKGPGSNSAFYRIRTKVAMIELNGWSGSLDVTLEEPHKTARLEVWHGIVVAVISASLNFLGMFQLGPKFRVDVFESSRKVGGSRNSRRGVLYQLRFEGGVEPDVGEKRRLFGGRVLGVVEHELSEREVVDPVVLLIGDVGTKVGLERLVGMLGESVGLRVIHRGGVCINLQKTCEL